MDNPLDRDEITIFPQNQITTPDYLRHRSPAPPLRTEPDEMPLRCVVFSQEYVQYIVALLDYYCWPDQFAGSPEEKEISARRFETLRSMFLKDSPQCEELHMLNFRQNPLNPCLLEYSVDGGGSWLLMFDYGRCRRDRPIIEIDIDQVQNFYDQSTTNYENYAGDIINVAPGWQYGDPDDQYRDMALCWGSEKWVEFCVSIAIQAGEQKTEETKSSMRWLGNALSALSDIISGVVILKKLSPYAMFGAIAIEVASIVVTVLAELEQFDASALNDQEAQTQVACEIYDAIKGTKPTYATWSAALQNHNLLGNEATIADATYLLMQSEEAFVNYMMVVAEIIPAAKISGDLGCPCDDVWEELIDCTASQLPGYLQVEYGTHVPGQGIVVGNYVVEGNKETKARVKLTPYYGDTTLTNVHLSYVNLSWGTLPSSYWGINMEGLLGTPPTYNQFAVWTRSQIFEGTGSREKTGSWSAFSLVACALRVSRWEYGGTGRMVAIRLRGLGENPFVE